MKRTKWATHKFSAGEKRARAKYRRAQENINDIHAAFRMYPMTVNNFISSRKELHRRLDQRLDVIEKTVASATELFPEVGESFTIATDTIRL